MLSWIKFKAINTNKRLSYYLSRRNYFKEFISRKHGQKCCPWGQNGKPLKEETVKEYIQGFQTGVVDGKQSVVWKPNENYTRLTAYFYVENIFTCVKFIQDLYNLDSETTKQIPGVQISDQDVFKIELHTPRLKGLSYKDLELASMINGFDLTKYKLTPMEDVSEVRQIKRQQQIDAENAQIQDEIARSAYKFGSSKFKKED